MNPSDLRERQQPLKEKYRNDPQSGRVTLAASGKVLPARLGCEVAAFNGRVEAGLHPAAGGDDSQACSGDMLLQALVACSGVTLSAVATAMSIPILRAEVEAAGEMDFRGTLAIDKSVPVGLQNITLRYLIDSPAEDAQLDKLIELTERYCVVLKSLVESPQLSCTWSRA